MIKNQYHYYEILLLKKRASCMTARVFVLNGFYKLFETVVSRSVSLSV